jgi:uncharacterized protein (TIGR02996 family)
VSEEAAFLAAIAADPADDTTRLVYADWLQDRNDPRPEYLRLEVRRHRMTPRERRKDDPFYQLERLRERATPDWLARIDRTTRFSIYWPQDICWAAEQRGLMNQPLAHVHSRGNHTTHFPKIMERGDYMYVFTFRARTLFLVGRMRIAGPTEAKVGGWSYVSGFDGTEGTPIRFDQEVPTEALARLSWYSGKTKERKLSLDAEGRMKSHESLNKVVRLTPRTAADLDAILRGDSVS